MAGYARFKSHLISAAALLCLAMQAFAEIPTDWPRGRLPGNVIPTAYDLDLTILPDEQRFTGRVQIRVEVREPLDGFWLHGKGFDISSVSVTPDGGAPVAAAWAEVGEEGEAWLALARELPIGMATVSLSFARDFESDLNGLYKVRVNDDAYAFTQFESIFARKAFPSFDEPAHKTPFSISVTTRNSYEALSNTPVINREELPGDLQRLTYAITAPLPTYLIAFAVGPLDVVEYAPVPPNHFRDRPLPLRGVAARGQGARLAYGLANTAPLVEELERYFGRAYPYEKLDIVAVPDFAAGAMENVGLITYREGLLLFNDPPPFDQQRWFGMVHAHELGHMWFGNLVTMPWWDDIWLNEAFASWIQAKAASVWRPDFRFEQFVQSQALRAMANDRLASARQIREPVNNKQDIISAFDTITYQKGAGVLQMFERYLGEETFKAGIQLHMRRFAGGSATVFDLIDSLQEVAPPGTVLKAPFESFLFQPGVPYLEVETACAADKLTVSVQQQRYLPLGSTAERDRQWQVPMCLSYGDDRGRNQACRLLSDQQQSFAIEVEACPDWVMPNADGAGYYRWKLSAGYEALGKHFLTVLNGGERLALIDTLAAGIEAGVVPPEVFFDQLALFARAPEPLAVTAAIDAYERMLSFFVPESARPAARAAGLQAFGPRFAGLSTESTLTDAERALLNQRLLKLLALTLRDSDTRALLRRQAWADAGYRVEPSGKSAAVNASRSGIGERGFADAGDVPLPPLDPDLRETAFIVGVQDSPAGFTRALAEAIPGSDDARWRYAGVRALAYATAPASQQLGREFALSGALRGNEFQAWAGALGNSDSGAANWNWVQENFAQYMAAASGRARRESPLYLGGGLCADDDAGVLRDLFTGLSEDYALNQRTLEQGIEFAELCAAARAELAPHLQRYFSVSDAEN